MNRHLLRLTLLLTARLLCAIETPTVDLYAGWSWLPYGYSWYDPYRYPYSSAGWPWRPHAGILFPLDGGDRLLRNGPYGYYGYGYAPYGWGFDYGVRMRLDDRPLFAMPDDPHTPPLPGSAPLTLRDPSEEESWTRAFNELLKGNDLEAWGVREVRVSTNAPAKDRKVKGYTSRSPDRTDCAICPDSPSTVSQCLAYGKWDNINAPANMCENANVAPAPRSTNDSHDRTLFATWAYRRIELVGDIVRSADSNAVMRLREILLGDKYFGEFLNSEKEQSRAESAYLGWQQYAAIQASRHPDIFGDVLVSYYYADLSTTLSEQSDAEQLRTASLKLIQEGPLYESQLNKVGLDGGSTHSMYTIRQIQISNDLATVDAAFLSPLASRGYRIQFRKARIRNDGVWLPYEKNLTWLN